MSVYFRTPEMQTGGPFKCFNCGKKLAVKLKGNCHVQFSCPRCKAFISVHMKEPVNWSKNEQQHIPTS
jgi:phage FluMu protein Com